MSEKTYELQVMDNTTEFNLPELAGTFQECVERVIALRGTVARATIIGHWLVGRELHNAYENLCADEKNWKNKKAGLAELSKQCGIALSTAYIWMKFFTSFTDKQLADAMADAQLNWTTCEHMARVSDDTQRNRLLKRVLDGKVPEPEVRDEVIRLNESKDKKEKTEKKEKKLPELDAVLARLNRRLSEEVDVLRGLTADLDTLTAIAVDEERTSDEVLLNAQVESKTLQEHARELDIQRQIIDAFGQTIININDED